MTAMTTGTMQSRSSLVREAVAAMRAYALEPREAEVKLDQNESPFDFPAALKQRVLARAAERPWNIYPDFELRRLRAAVASFRGVAMKNVLVGNGSNELLFATLAAFVEPGRRVIFPSPTFPLYEKIVRTFGGEAVPVPFDPSAGVLPVDAMLEAAGAARGDATFVVCSPNNPTGSVLPNGALERLLESGAMVLLDRAYGEFDGAPFPPLHERLAVFTTFSKAFGLAGLRIGSVISTEENCREVRKVKLPYNLNFLSEEAAVVALEALELVAERIASVLDERARLFERLASVPGVRPYPSRANFIAFELDRSPGAVFEALHARGILVRDVSAYPSMERALRVTVGSSAQNDRFLTALEEVMR